MEPIEVVAEVQRLIRAEAELHRVKEELRVFREEVPLLRQRAEAAECALTQEHARNEMRRNLNVKRSFKGWMLSGDLAGSPFPPYEFGNTLPQALFGIIETFVTRPPKEGITLSLKREVTLPEKT